MPVYMKPASVIIANLGLKPNGQAHTFFTNTCALHMDKFVPWDTGALAETVVINGRINHANVSTDTIVYNQDYAKYVYYGENKNFQHDTHPNACAYWDKAMWSADKHKVIKEVQNYFNKFGGKR